MLESVGAAAREAETQAEVCECDFLEGKTSLDEFIEKSIELRHSCCELNLKRSSVQQS